MVVDPTMRDLVSALADAKRVYGRLAFDEDEPMELGKPASSEQIRQLEGRLRICIAAILPSLLRGTQRLAPLLWRRRLARC